MANAKSDDKRRSQAKQNTAVPYVRRALAIFASDLHLTLKPPIARSAEPDWLAAVERQLLQLNELAFTLGAKGEKKLPIFYPGDIFDRWNPPVELVNWAIKHLPKGFAIPGQHDLPYHNINDIHRTGYWTLVSAGVLKHLTEPRAFDEFVVHPFAWGADVEGPGVWQNDARMQVAMIHAYCWSKGASYPDAPFVDNITNWMRRLHDYDAAFFGDNHQGFEVAHAVNCGTFMRRKIDEFHYQPCVGVLWSDSAVSRHELDCSADKFVEIPFDQDWNELANYTEFLEELKQTFDSELTFSETVKQFIARKRIKGNLRDFLLNAIEEG